MREQETPRRSHQGWDLHRDRDVYGDRDKVECLVGCLKQWRRIAARHEKRAASYLAMLALATFVFDL
jgi:transposase